MPTSKPFRLGPSVPDEIRRSLEKQTLSSTGSTYDGSRPHSNPTGISGRPPGAEAIEQLLDQRSQRDNLTPPITMAEDASHREPWQDDELKVLAQEVYQLKKADTRARLKGKMAERLTTNRISKEEWSTLKEIFQDKSLFEGEAIAFASPTWNACYSYTRKNSTIRREERANKVGITGKKLREQDLEKRIKNAKKNAAQLRLKERKKRANRKGISIEQLEREEFMGRVTKSGKTATEYRKIKRAKSAENKK